MIWSEDQIQINYNQYTEVWFLRWILSPYHTIPYFYQPVA